MVSSKSSDEKSRSATTPVDLAEMVHGVVLVSTVTPSSITRTSQAPFAAFSPVLPGPASSCRSSRTACSPSERCDSPSSFFAHLTAGPDRYAPPAVTRQRPEGTHAPMSQDTRSGNLGDSVAAGLV